MDVQDVHGLEKPRMGGLKNDVQDVQNVQNAFH